MFLSDLEILMDLDNIYLCLSVSMRNQVYHILTTEIWQQKSSRPQKTSDSTNASTSVSQVVPILHPSSLGSSDASCSLEIEVKRTEQQVKTLQNSVVIPLMKTEFSLDKCQH